MKRLLLTTLLVVGCATPETKTDVVWVDHDKNPIDPPEEYWSGLMWDGADKMVFRPLSHFWLFDVKGPAHNVNILEEVPNSSWYTNRLALKQMTPEEVANGPCDDKPINVDGPLIVIGGKTDGANPGFTVKDPSTGKGYLLKFDGSANQEYRATAADVIGSKIYYAAGFETPCNEVIYFKPEILQIGEKANKKDALGRKSPMTQRDVDRAIAGVKKEADGTIRGSASEFIKGRPIGPFTYEETRSDDPNDVINHEDRRELRGSRLLGAWTNHFDAREQNTLTSFIEDKNNPGKGYVQHYIIDWGDIFGSRWVSDAMSRKFGHAYYFDFSLVMADLFTLGAIKRPWDKQVIHEEGSIFGYYDVEMFEPQKWKDGYPNASFNYMDDTDAYWMTRIISRFQDAHVEALVAKAKIPNPDYNKYLSAMIRGRRDKVVKYYFDRMSSLDRLRFKGREVCMDDLVVVGGYDEVKDAFYQFSYDGEKWFAPETVESTRVCHTLPADEKVELRARVRRNYQRTPAKHATFTLEWESNRWHLRRVQR